ncbi:MAG: hypothetical protein R2702_05170 [Acidimicrobiales bacterium]
MLDGRQVAHRRAHAQQEDVAQPGQQRLAEHPGVAARGHGVRHRDEGRARVAGGHGVEQVVDRLALVDHATGGRHPLERREGVSGRPAAHPHHVLDGVVAEGEAGVVDDPAHVLRQVFGAEQAELEVLGAAADGGQHLVRVGGGQHEHHVLGRLLERLQERRRRLLREHVDLVEDVHLRAPRRPQGHPADQLAHVLHATVGGGVELLHVVGGAVVDGDAALADAAGLAALEVLAVERLGEDARRGGLARAAGPAEEVGVADALLADRVAQRPDDLLLVADVAEAPGPVAPVEGLVRHGCSPYRSGPTAVPGPGAVRSGTVRPWSGGCAGRGWP